MKRFNETKAKLRANIKACPYKGAPYTRCITCECRTVYLKKFSQFWTRHEDLHWPMSTLSPAAECDTGR